MFLFFFFVGVLSFFFLPPPPRKQDLHFLELYKIYTVRGGSVWPCRRGHSSPVFPLPTSPPRCPARPGAWHEAAPKVGGWGEEAQGCSWGNSCSTSTPSWGEGAGSDKDIPGMCFLVWRFCLIILFSLFFFFFPFIFGAPTPGNQICCQPPLKGSLQ